MIVEEDGIVRWKRAAAGQASIEVVRDWLALESILTIAVNGQDIARLSCSPGNCSELAIGFLFTEGFISGFDDIAAISHDGAQDRIAIELRYQIDTARPLSGGLGIRTSGCGGGIHFDADELTVPRVFIETDFRVEPEFIIRVVNNLREFSGGYRRTGCFHEAALCSATDPPLIREDIGRHNAVDKVIGAAISLRHQLRTTVLASSGRLSAEIIRKAARAGIPVVVSRSAPTSMAVHLARKFAICMIGFARGGRMNIYSHEARVMSPSPIDSNSKTGDPSIGSSQ